jgi:hypothetical protein
MPDLLDYAMSNIIGEDKMENWTTAKYVKESPIVPNPHQEVTSPMPTLNSDENFGNHGFNTYWVAITQDFVMSEGSHKHDYPQYLTFLGGDITNMIDLGGVVELTLSVDGINLEKHIINRATTVYIPPGLFHGPLVYKNVTKPILFNDIYFAKKHERKY